MIKKVLIIILSLIVLAALVVGGIFVKNKFFSGDKDSDVTEEEFEELPPLRVNGTLVDMGDIIVWVEGLGKIDALQRVDFYSPENTTIERLYVKEGDSVNKGQRLAQLYYGTELASYEQALFELEKARKRFEFAKEIEGDSNITLLRMNSGLVDAEREFTRVSRNIQHLNIKAPFDGVISNLTLNAGSSVRAGDLVLSVYSDGGMEIVANIPQVEIRGIVVGNKAIITSIDGEKSEEGVVKAIAPVIDDRGTGSVTIGIESVDWMLGEVVKVDIESQKYEDRVRVPFEAVLHREERFLVFAVREDKAKWEWIEKGKEGRDYIEVLDGVVVGDTILVEGQFTIAHDARVEVIFE